MGYKVAPAFSHETNSKHVVVDRLNAKTWANKFQAKVIKAGLVSYKDVECGVAMVKQETLARNMQSFVGRPLVLTRNENGKPTYRHKKVTPATLEQHAEGYITDVYFDADSGWWCCNGIVHSDDAKEAIKRIGYVSCAYAVNATGRGGEEHAIPYDEEITQFSGEHLAIVDNPRYEGATIRLNAKNNKQNPMKFTWFKKSASRENAGADAAKIAADKLAADKAAADAALADKENSKGDEITGDSEFEIAGEKVALSALVEAWNAKEKKEMDGEDEVVCNGKTYKMNALIQAFDKWETTSGEQMKQNEKAASDEAARVQAEADEVARKENEKKVAKPDHYKVLLNAPNLIPASKPQNFDTPASQYARGKEMYGSAPAAK